MSQFPSVETDELVTKQFLRAELGGLRAEFRSEFGELRTDFGGEIVGLRGKLGALRLEMVERSHRQTLWLAGTVATATGAIIASAPLLS